MSRLCRHKLAIVCVEGYAEVLSRQESRASPIQAFADDMGVTYRTVQRWIDADSIQSCNANADRIVEVALRLNPEKARKMLVADLRWHREQLRDKLDEIRQGDVVPSPLRAQELAAE